MIFICITENGARGAATNIRHDEFQSTGVTNPYLEKMKAVDADVDGDGRR